MAKDKTSFVLYSDQRTVVDMLSDEQAGKLLKHIYSYVNDENPELDDLALKLAFEPIKLQLKRDLKKWEKQLKQRSEAGKASAEIRKRNSTSVNERSIPSTDNVNVTVNENVNEIKDNSIVESIDFDVLLSFINKTLDRKFRTINKAIQKSYKARLKEGYTKEDIKTAIINASNNDYHKETNYQYLTPKFFSRFDKLDLYSNVTENKDSYIHVDNSPVN